MSKGRGKNAPDRAEMITAQGVEIIDAEPLNPVFPLGPDAQAMWDRLTSQMQQLKMLKLEDVGMLQDYCMQYQIWCDAARSYLAEPPETRTRERTLTGTKRNTDIDIMASASDRMMKIAKQMGWSPAARSTLQLNQAITTGIMATALPEKIERMYQAAKLTDGNRK